MTRLCLLLLLIASSTLPMWGEELSPISSSDQIEPLAKSPWFNPDTNSIVPVPLADERSDTVHRDSRWLPPAKRIAKPTPTGAAPSTGWFNTGLTTANLIGWALLGVLLVALTAAILYAFSKIDPSSMQGLDSLHSVERNQLDKQTLKRIEELPAELRRTDVDLRTEAERLMHAGYLDEAIKCLFGHQLLLLDGRGFLRLTRGKTNSRYVAETRRSMPPVAVHLRSTADAFEASYFGRHTPTKEAFSRLWQGNLQLEALTASKSEAAA